MRLMLAASMCALALSAQGQTSLVLMPMPSSVRSGSGQLVVDPSFSAAITGTPDAILQRGVERFLDRLRRQTGMSLLNLRVVEGSNAPLIIHVEHGSKEVQELDEDESYSLEVAASGATLNAPTTLGALHGLQTFLQLVQTTSSGFAVPAVNIQDTPRFPWRGLMIDVSRHFIPLDVLKRNLDGMEAVKLNVFHWHLSDNQGFRVESRKFPKLQEMGSDGLYYTQEQVRDVIAYAHDRGIRVVPEFDMPGHATAWFVGYPELASGPGPYQIERKWGVFDPAMNPTEESTYKFLDKFIGEMAELFPDQFFHIGGDEVNGKEWDANPKIQAFMREHGMKSNTDLQAYFNTHVQEIVSRHGKTMEGWDEILRPDLPKSIVIQSWRGQTSLAGAANLGYRGLLSSGYYLDLMYPASQHYAVDPMSGAAAALSGEEKGRILGGEACEWSEYASPENIDSRIWPRTAPIAERLWSPQNVTDVASMYTRMEAVSRQLEGLGLTHNSYYEPMLRRIAGIEDLGPVRTLADVVEPVKEYAREEQAVAEATSFTPLNRLVDAAHPESDKVREFSIMVDSYLAGTLDATTKAAMRQWLASWRDNDAALQPVIAGSFLLQDDAALSRSLSVAGRAGLQAMDFIEGKQRPTSDWIAQQTALLTDAAKPSAQLLLMVVPPVQKLLAASQNGPVR
jgi:hexosaminidase